MLGYQKATYHSHYPVQETIDKLRTNVWYLHNTDKDAPLVGTISTSKIRVYQSPFKKMWLTNSFRPVFHGTILENHGLAMIQGKYTFHIVVRAFILFCFVIMIGAGISKPNWTIPLIGIPLFSAIAVIGYWISYDEVKYIDNIIKTALSKNE